jgi:hypothetical protein
VVLYSPRGESEDLTPGGAGALIAARQALQVVIPRRAPPGVREPELHVAVVAGPAPLTAAVWQLLHLPCQAHDNRGDRDGTDKLGDQPDKSGDKPGDKHGDKPGDKKGGGSKGASSGKPSEPDRGGSSPVAGCALDSGASAPLALRTLVLASQ